MNKIIFVIILMGFSLMSQAQGRRGNMEEKIEAKKVGYLTEKLDLSSEEAQVFWPIYNAYSESLKTLSPKNDEERNENVNADAEIENYLSIEKEKINIREKYISKFKEIIGSERTLILLQSERGFKREMLKSIRKRKEKGFKGMMKEKGGKKDK